MSRIEIINPLDLDGFQKVVQLNMGDISYLLYGGSFHSDILELFLRAQNISYNPVQAPGVNHLMMVPPLEGDGYIVRGMGSAGFYFSEKVFTGMRGKSVGYDLGIHEEDKNTLVDMLKADSWRII